MRNVVRSLHSPSDAREPNAVEQLPHAGKLQ